MNVFEQAEHWASVGHEVTVVCADPGRQHAPDQTETGGGVRVVRMGNRFTVYIHAAAYLVTQGHRFDAILDVSNGVPFFSPLFTSAPSVLLVHHVHEGQWVDAFPWPFSSIGRWLEHKVVPAVYRGRRVIAVSSSTRADLVRLGYSGNSIVVVENGVRLPYIDPPPTRLPGPRILYLGRLKRYKRIDKVIRAMESLARIHPHACLDIAGDGDARAELEDLVDELRLRDRTTFYGFVDERTKLQLFNSATVFVNASSHEGWGISVIEANACGCPAVAFDVPGLQAAIRHCETGLLVDDDEGLRRALATLIEDPDTRDALGARAKQWAATFDWESCARKTLALLEEARWPTNGHPGNHGWRA